MVDEKQVSEIVKNVIAGMDISSFDNKPARKQLGVFDTMEEAIAACKLCYKLQWKRPLQLVTKLTRPLDIIIKNKGKIS